MRKGKDEKRRGGGRGERMKEANWGKKKRSSLGLRHSLTEVREVKKNQQRK